MADPYTGARYGTSSFRDLNILVQGYSTKGARDFFRDMLLRNCVYYPDKLVREDILGRFEKLDKVFKSQDSTVYDTTEMETRCELLQE